jgi:membrane-associated phospholipid phosphatase
MLDTTLVLWLQERASPALTEVMWAVSILGYVPSCLAVAAVCGFGWRLRTGVTLVLAVVSADAMTVVAKGALASPRPHAVDARVQTLGHVESSLVPTPSATSVPADDFGFPSGHVATTAAWALGLAWTRRKPWHLAAAGTWVGLMALSRLYLGRHFPADVVGGVMVGLAGVAVARLVIPPEAGTQSAGARAGLGAALLALVAVAVLAGAGPGAHDAGRVCGLVGASLLLLRTRAVDEVVPPATRLARMAVAFLLLGVALWSSAWTTGTGAGPAATSMVVSAALHASALLAPALAIGSRRS